MKTIRIFSFLLLAVTAFSLQSCLKDDTEYFDDSASARMSKYMEQTKKTILDGGTWLFEMYPESEQSLGGYAFTLKFTEKEVEVRSELFGSGESATSMWKMTNDDGPAISFDSYNEILHFLSTPSSSNYQAYYGEFEWIIIKAEPEMITLRGKKTGNTMYMYKLTQDPEEYLDAVAETEENMILNGLKASVGSSEVNGIVDTDNRQLEFTDSEGKTTVAYALTDKGLRLYKPITIGGVEISNLDLTKDESGNLTGLTSNAGNFFAAVYPEGWRKYDDYLGEYTLNWETIISGKYTPTKTEISIVPNTVGSDYLIKGLNMGADIVATYKKSTGVLMICSQVLGPVPGSTDNVWLCAWSIDGGGSLTWSTDAGMVTKWNGDETNPVYTFEDNQGYSLVIDSFLLWRLTSGNSSVGVFQDTAWRFYGAEKSSYPCRLPYLVDATLVKK